MPQALAKPSMNNLSKLSPPHPLYPQRQGRWPAVAAAAAADGAARFDWLLLSFWAAYAGAYVVGAWTILRWATLPVVGS